MADGKLALAAPAAATNTTVYTVPNNCKYAKIDVNILNPDASDATVELALTTNGTPALNEYIEKGAIVPSGGGSLERINLICSPGEILVVKSSLATTVVRVSGNEVI